LTLKGGTKFELSVLICLPFLLLLITLFPTKIGSLNTILVDKLTNNFLIT